MKKILIKGIVIFGILMVVCTIISRIVFQMCTPNVVVTEAKEGTIVTRMEMEGCVRGKQEVAVISKEGLQIEFLYVEEGDYVTKGDVLYQYNIEELKKSIRKQRDKELEEFLECEGQVYAKVDGQVAKVYIEPGSMTTGTADMLLINEAGSKVVEFTLEDSGEESVDAEEINVGSKVLVSAADGDFQECEVIGKQQEESGAWRFVVDVSELKAGINETVTIQIQNRMNPYLYVIPREALRQGEGNKYFVYVAEEKETVLGTEYRVRRQEVEVLEMNSWEAAIENISFTQKIVTDSDKPLRDNCRISYIVEE